MKKFSNPDLVPPLFTKSESHQQRVKVPYMHFDRYLEDSCELELEKRINKLGKKKDKKTEDQIVAIINAMVYRQELRQQALTSS